MKNTTEVDDLRNRIALLHQQQQIELVALKEQFKITKESLQPINLLKNSIKEVVASPDLKTTIFKNVVGLATGYLSKKVLIGATHNPIKKILGTVLEFIIANVVANRVNTSK